MRQSAVVLMLGLLGPIGCSPPPCEGTSCSMMQEPPQVFITAPITNVVGTSFKVRVNVTGCTRVEQLQLEQNKVLFKTANFRGPNTEIEVLPGDIASFYGALGIAADLTVAARAICDDGRNNRSTPVAIKFFPVATVVEPSNGQVIVLPDSFVAEGGVAGAPVTFIGCANTGQGLSLVRVDQGGNVVGLNSTLPFGCDYYATITEKVNGSWRWLYQPGFGAFAFDQGLNITGGIVGDSFAVFAAGPDGDALIWDSQAGTGNALTKVRRGNGTAMGPNTAWTSPVPGIVNGQPVFDSSTGLALLPSWRVGFGNPNGTQTVQQVNYSNGNIVGEVQVVTQRFEALEAQNPPQVAFSPDARTIYVAFPIQASPNQSGVMACGTQGSASSCSPRWRSVTLDGIVRFIIPFAAGTKIAAISDNKVWFLEESSMPTAGRVLNPNGVPASAAGTQLISGAQAGLGSDFYLFTGTPFSTEIIAFDTPSNGEVYRYALGGGGDTAQNALTMAIDDNGTPWLRIGVNQVKPLSLTEYRNARGATP